MENESNERQPMKYKVPETKMNFWKTYFNYGYFLESSSHTAPPETKLRSLVGKHLRPFYDQLTWYRPRWIALLLPALFGFILNLLFMTLIARNNLWRYYSEPHIDPDGRASARYLMSIAMIFGSMVAGGTSEGGGSIAFPVMTLVFGIRPPVARDYALMIQSFGMSAAATSIFYYNGKVEQHALFYSSAGGIVGVTIGLACIAPNLAPAVAKMFFVSAWLSFAVSLFIVNRNRARVTYLQIPNFTCWKAGALLLTGVIGGMMTSISGSGIDICTFASLTLLFRCSEKVATTTSVVLMAINTVAGFTVKGFFLGGMEPDAWPFVIVTVMIVMFGAPLGTWLASTVHRLVLASIVYITVGSQFALALALVKQDIDTVLVTVVTFAIGSCIFASVSRLGHRLERHEAKGKQTQQEQQLFAEMVDKTAGMVEQENKELPINANSSGLPNWLHKILAHPMTIFVFFWVLPFSMLCAYQIVGWGIANPLPSNVELVCFNNTQDWAMCDKFDAIQEHCENSYCGWGVGFLGCATPDIASANQSANCVPSL